MIHERPNRQRVDREAEDDPDDCSDPPRNRKLFMVFNRLSLALVLKQCEKSRSICPAE